MTKKVFCGQIPIGGGSPISIQSMTNTDTKDISKTIQQIDQLVTAGCQIVRLAILDMEAAAAFGEIKKQTKVPLVADIHFDYRLAIEAIKQGADKIRINPGNIGDIERIKAVVDQAKAANIPIRVGVNGGSLEKEILASQGGVTPEALVMSAIKNTQIIEDLGYDNLVISLKASNPTITYQAYKEIREKTDYPLHIGLTEAGYGQQGIVKSASVIGALLMENIGDTLRVSLTGDPVHEIKVAREILYATGKRIPQVEMISCPTCGRTSENLEANVIKIETMINQEILGRKSQTETIKETDSLNQAKSKPGNVYSGTLKIAVMGCQVNGPGEAREADYGIAYGKGKCTIFAKGEIVKTVDSGQGPAALIEEIKTRETTGRS